MNTRIWKFTGTTTTMLILAGSLLAPLRHLHAQSTFALPFSSSQSNPATTFSIDANGTLVEQGTLNSSATFSLASGPKMVWFPAFGAFRVGSFSGSQTNIGQYSFATGSANASGGYAFATGSANNASGNSSLASGLLTNAAGSYTLTAGFETSAVGFSSVAMGSNTTATGSDAVSTGGGTTASGGNSMATGASSTASGASSFSAGTGTVANSLASFVVGGYNIGVSSTGAAPNATSWVATDPLFEIGNGTSSSAKSDALVVYKNGNAVFKGVVMVAPGGDIPMYTGN